MIKLMDLLNEGVNDPGIFKAVFLAGGPGSGKSFVASQLFGIPEKINVSTYGLKMVNQDQELEMFLKKYFGTLDIDNMPKDLYRQLTDPEYDDYSGMRSYTKTLSKVRMQHYIKGRMGVIIDGTGHKFGKLKKRRKELMEYGYDTFMVFVNTSLEVAKQRNKERARRLPEDILVKSWKDVQNNLGKFQGLFGTNFAVVDNSKFMKPEEAQKKFGMIVKKYINKFIKGAVRNPIGKKWIKHNLILKGKK